MTPKQRAQALLESFLTPDQHKAFLESGRFCAVGSQSGLIYYIVPPFIYSLHQKPISNEFLPVKEIFCARLNMTNMAYFDEFLALKIVIENDEEYFLVRARKH